MVSSQLKTNNSCLDATNANLLRTFRSANRLSRRSLLISSFAFIATTTIVLTTACASPPISVDKCGSAFESLSPVEPLDGLHVIVSYPLAATLNSCLNLAEWHAELVKHPSAVGLDVIPQEDLVSYLVGACSLLPNFGSGNHICDEGRAQGYFD